MKFSSTKRGALKVLAMLKGGGGAQQVFGVVFMWCLEVFDILKGGGGGGAKSFHTKGGGAKSFTLS